MTGAIPHARDAPAVWPALRGAWAELRTRRGERPRHDAAPTAGSNWRAGNTTAPTSTSPPRTIGVLICSYQRPGILSRALAALAAQERAPDDVIVVARDDDAGTLEFLGAARTDGLALRAVVVAQPGTVHALNAGLAACRTDVLAITDDDTVPHADWLARIFAHFATDLRLGGLGGRDWCHDGVRFDDRSEPIVGHLQWFGRTIGNHHLGTGAPRKVDFLKGANMSYRADVVTARRFDTRLRGTGVQPNEDLTFSIGVGRAGWKLLYDPLVAVDHYPARRLEPRHYGGVSANTEGLSDLAFNECVAVLQGVSAVRGLFYLLWSVIIGTGVSPGLLQAIRYTRRLGRVSWQRFSTVQAGKLAAVRTLAATGSTRMPPRSASTGYGDRLPMPKP